MKKIKLKYDFPTQLSTEIFRDNIWQRVTCKDFRSFNGARRILKFDVKGDSFYEDYNGPVYLYETNTQLKDLSKFGMIYPYDTPPKIKLRPWEGHYLDDERIKNQIYGTEKNQRVK